MISRSESKNQPAETFEIGLYTFGELYPDPHTGRGGSARTADTAHLCAMLSQVAAAIELLATAVAPVVRRELAAR